MELRRPCTQISANSTDTLIKRLALNRIITRHVALGAIRGPLAATVPVCIVTKQKVEAYSHLYKMLARIFVLVDEVQAWAKYVVTSTGHLAKHPLLFDEDHVRSSRLATCYE